MGHVKNDVHSYRLCFVICLCNATFTAQTKEHSIYTFQKSDFEQSLSNKLLINVKKGQEAYIIPYNLSFQCKLNIPIHF